MDELRVEVERLKENVDGLQKQLSKIFCPPFLAKKYLGYVLDSIRVPPVMG